MKLIQTFKKQFQTNSMHILVILKINKRVEKPKKVMFRCYQAILHFSITTKLW